MHAFGMEFAKLCITEKRISIYVSVELRVVSGEACHVHACI